MTSAPASSRRTWFASRRRIAVFLVACTCTVALIGFAALAAVAGSRSTPETDMAPISNAPQTAAAPNARYDTASAALSEIAVGFPKKAIQDVALSTPTASTDVFG